MLLYGGIIGYYEHAEPSLIFHPEKPGPPEITAGAQAVHLTAADGVPLFGWIIKADPAKYPYWILYFHGNEGTVASPTDWYRIFHELGMSVFTIDYRGYGQSEGTPSEAGLYLDAEASYDYLVKTLSVPESRIVIYGHSLGSAVAVHLASREHPAGLILEGALISIAARGRELCPFLPVGLMVRNRFDTWTAIESVRCPKLFLHGNQDRLVPIAHGRYLYDHASPPKTWLELNGDHGTSIDDPRVPQALRAFVDSLPK